MAGVDWKSPSKCQIIAKRAMIFSILTFAVLRSAYLDGVDLSSAKLRNANLDRVDLRESNLTDAYLHDTDFMGSNLTDAYIGDTNLTGASFTRADLNEADLELAENLDKAYLPRGWKEALTKVGLIR